MTRSLSVAVAAALLLSAGAAFAAVKQSAPTVQASLRKQVESHSALSDEARTIVVRYLLPMTANPAWVKAVAEQNGLNITLQAIQDASASWDSAEDELPIQRTLLSNACAKQAIQLTQALPAVREVFVLDNQGAAVCMTNLSRPYWQGGLASWQEAFAGGSGGVSVEPVQYDETAYAHLQHVSLPIVATSGEVIGAVTFGIAVPQS